MVDKPILIIVNGTPGAGKTTLSKKMAKDLRLPCLNKDDIKELLFDKLGAHGLEWSKDLGAGVSEMLFTFIDKWTERGRDLIAESAYYYEFAEPCFKATVKNNNIAFLEIYCKVGPEERRRRVAGRIESGERHPGHADNTYNGESDDVIDARYAPLRVGSIIEVDTTDFGEQEYREFLVRVRQFIATAKEGNK